MFAYLIAEPGLPLLFLYLHLLSLNKDDHFLITSTYSLLIYKSNTWYVCIFELHIAVVANAPDLQENKNGGFFRIISI